MLNLILYKKLLTKIKSSIKLSVRLFTFPQKNVLEKWANPKKNR